MTKKLFLITIAIILNSCSLPATKIEHAQFTPQHDTALLKNIVIKSFGTERFSGLLGVMKRHNGLFYVLLDATGIKLLEVEVENEENYSIKGGINKIKESSLPKILSQSLRRIFVIKPTELPCSTHYLHKLCHEQINEQDWVKYSQTGPFTKWKVSYKNGNQSKIILSQPWIGLTITLSEVKD